MMADNSEELAESLDRLFHPRHIAVIGAARTPDKLGHAVVRNLVRGGYAGRVSAINSVGAEVEGRSGYRSVARVPARPDCAFIAIPAAGVLDAIRDCVDAGVRFAIVGASGFAELGTAEGSRRQAEMAEIARAGGLRIIGPNTNGILDVHARLSLGYNASHAEIFEPGVVSIVSHSGALFDGIARRLRRAGAGLAKFVATGNEADLTLLDFLEYLVTDEATRVIGIVVEAISDGARFRQLAVQARNAGKFIVALKVGRTASGAEATLAHSNRLAGNARAHVALMRESGVAIVTTVEALACGCALLAAQTRAANAHDRGLVCVSTSGAGGAILADFAADRGIPLAGDGKGNWRGSVADGLANIRSWARVRNPIDLGALGDWSLLSQVLSALEANGVTGPTVTYAHVAPGPGMAEQLANALIRRRRSCPAPSVVVSPGGLTDPVEGMYARAGILLFHDTAACFDSLQCYYACIEHPPAAPPDEAFRSRTALGEETGRLLQARPQAGGASDSLSELESAELLRRAGVPMVRSAPVRSLEEALEEAARAGYPVALKAVEPRAAHKHRSGLVVTNIPDGDALAREYAALRSRALPLSGAVADRVQLIVQPMVRSKAELILGVSFDEALGHFLLFGPGGVHAELYDQITLLPVPVIPDTLRLRVHSSPLGRLLASVAADDEAEALLQQTCSVLAALQDLVIAHGERIQAIDVNPLIVCDGECIAVDALIVRRAIPPRVRTGKPAGG